MSDTINRSPETPSFRSFRPEDSDACLALFDANCPTYFAPNERDDYRVYLSGHPADYELCIDEGEIVGAFGLHPAGRGARRLQWIMLHPASQGRGIGALIMRRVEVRLRTLSVRHLHIAASHLSAPFFERFGAIATGSTEHGWGPGMHRVDMIWERPEACEEGFESEA